MATSNRFSIRACFADLPDPRREHMQRHDLWDIIAITILAVIANCNNWVEIAAYGVKKHDWLKTFLDLPNGIPSHDTFGRVFALLDPGAFGRCFAQWIEVLASQVVKPHVAIDGKAARHSFDTAEGKGPLHMVVAWASEYRLLLGQQACDSKSNEITAIPELIKTLEITGGLVTIDAMGCQKNIAADIREAGADYILAVKDNQPKLHQDIIDAFLAALDNDFADVEHERCHTAEKGHGRVEKRTYYVMPIPEEMKERHADWQDFRSIGMVLSERQEGKKEASLEVRYFMTSLRPKVARFARGVRNHWSVETGLHWVLDVCFREDDSRLRKGNGPTNLAMIRRLTASLLRNEATVKAGVECKRKCAGWDDDYLIQVLADSLI
jgi:predicted transposase YbfD/YdcC